MLESFIHPKEYAMLRHFPLLALFNAGLVRTAEDAGSARFQ